jgi:hypothetical protein
MSSCASSFASSSSLRHSRRKPLAAGVCALFALSAPDAIAVPPAVTNCNDSGAGSLRYAVDPVNGAISGDTIDMSTLACGTITLTTGAIVATQQKLTIQGPGRHALYITGASNAPNSRIIVHSYMGSTGHLYVNALEVDHAAISTSSGGARGGCIASLSGSLTLSHVNAYHCSVTTTAASSYGNALGGAVFAPVALTIDHSTLLHHGAYTANNNPAQGGCAATMGAFDMSDSTVAYCSTTGPTGSYKIRGGALELRGNAKITGSVIGKGYSNYVGGVDIFSGAPGGVTATISNSTITLNSAHGVIGGLYANSGHININNSTIVLNTAGRYTYTPNANTYNAAVGVSLASTGATFSLQSTIIANNSSNGTQEDLSFGASTGLTVAASNNLVRAYMSDVTLPGAQGNLPLGTCPKLGTIRDNGGVSFTHALQSGSAAIDAGNNSANDPHTGVPAVYDQRGQGPVSPLYERVSGPSADIGAYEYQKTDIIFSTEMETGCE